MCLFGVQIHAHGIGGVMKGPHEIKQFLAQLKDELAALRKERDEWKDAYQRSQNAIDKFYEKDRDLERELRLELAKERDALKAKVKDLEDVIHSLRITAQEAYDIDQENERLKSLVTQLESRIPDWEKET